MTEKINEGDGELKRKDIGNSVSPGELSAAQDILADFISFF